MEKNFDIFNVCTSKPLHITKVIKEINKYSVNPRVIKKPRDKADVYKTFGSNKKIVNFLKIKIRFTN